MWGQHGRHGRVWGSSTNKQASRQRQAGRQAGREAKLGCLDGRHTHGNAKLRPRNTTLAYVAHPQVHTLSHLSGKTPQWSWPTTLRPLMARDLAESPSVRIRVHMWLLRVPASLASDSLATPACVFCGGDVCVCDCECVWQSYNAPQLLPYMRPSSIPSCILIHALLYSLLPSH